MKEEEEGGLGEGSHLNQSRARRRELEGMVPVGRYCQLYKELKEKHGPHLVKVKREKVHAQKQSVRHKEREKILGSTLVIA